jgi:predicted neutral ceramidase superfamily lipid hydrolase
VHNLRRDIEDVVDDEDLDDVQKLNVVLKSMKSEVIIDSQNSNNEEYGAMKNDVQLLKEILHYEKIKVKSDPNCL